MSSMRIFISSVQKELAEERVALREYLRGDALLSRFFVPVLFEDGPAADRSAQQVYLDQVEGCDVYIGLFADEYGYEDAEGVSPTEREFALATERGKTRLVFVKGASDEHKHPKMRVLIRRAGDELIRRRFSTTPELIAAVYSALVHYLEARELIRTGPFDASACRGATLEDLDSEKIGAFVRQARHARRFPLPASADSIEVLTHLNLLPAGEPSHAAVLLFGKQPQRFLISSEIKCAHFHGTEQAKPIPSYQVYKGTLFQLVDEAVDFVMSKLNLWVGTRAQGPQAPVAYEIPQEVVSEAIVNAVAHRDYTSNGSVQVMLFADRLEVWNPGALPPSLTLQELREPHASVPANPLIAEPLYLTKYIERMGTGTGDMIRRCRAAGLPEPEFTVRGGFFVATVWRKPAGQPGSVAGAGPQPESRPTEPESGPTEPESGSTEPESRPESDGDSLEIRVLRLLMAEALSKSEISARLGQKEISGRLNQVMRVLLGDHTIELTLPDKPKSRLQQYRLTDKGAQLLASLNRLPGRKPR